MTMRSQSEDSPRARLSESRDSVLRHHDAAAGPGRISGRGRQPVAALHTDQGIDVVVGIESRGFIFGAAVADRIGAGFSPVRKPGKLPSTCVRATYSLEYGTDTLEMHAGRRAIGTARADRRRPAGNRWNGARDTRSRARLGGTVHGLAFLIELVALNGRAKLAGEQVSTVLQY